MILREGFNFGENIAEVGISAVFNDGGSYNCEFVSIEVSGTFVGTIIAETNLDQKKGSFFPVQVIDYKTMDFLSEITEPGQYMVLMAGLKRLRFKVTSLTSGSINIYGRVMA